MSDWYGFEPYCYENDLKRVVFWEDFHRRVFALFPLCMATTFLEVYAMFDD